jgi:hypothetical protein
MTAHPAALVLTDHQPVYVTASTQPGSTVRCCCGEWAGPWCEFATHQTEALVEARLLAPGTPCGDLSPAIDLGGGELPRSVCDEPSGHRGAHRRGDMTWRTLLTEATP